LRRLVIEFSVEQSDTRSQVVPGPPADLLVKIDSFEILNALRLAPGEFSVVARIKLNDPSFKVEELFPTEGLEGSELETELLEKESDTTFIYFIRATVRSQPRQTEMPYLAMPFEYRDKKLRVSFLGSSSQIKRYLAILSKESNIRYRIASLTVARFPPNSPLGRLTDKQRRALNTAYRLGYYEVPRRITSEELAKKLNLEKSTFSAHVRKAERTLLKELLSDL
jgi:HTH DNA binding domain